MHALTPVSLFRILFTLLLIISFDTKAQTPYFESHAGAILKLVQKNHIAPKALNDSLSFQLYDQFIETIDPERLYFTKKDLAQFHTFRHLLDDEFSQNKWTFIQVVSATFIQKLKGNRKWIEEATTKPFDFYRKETLPQPDTAWAIDERQLVEKWRKHFRQETLTVLSRLAENQLEQKGTINKTEILQQEAATRLDLRTTYLQELDAMLGSEKELITQMAATYLNVFLQCMDPHSSFFDLNEKKAFEQQLNTEGYFFGLVLGQNEKHEVIISRLVPGGAAWLSGDLNKDDVIIQLKWQNGEALNVSAFSPAEIATLLDDPSRDKLEITVRKTNGQVSSVTLQKTKIENEDNIVKSFLLEGQHKVGYISLPSFYTEWEETEGSKCAADAAREIIKLKKEGIQGLILDLRFNGGGSLGEAVEMAGIFIDEGAVTQIRTREPKPVVLKDMNRGVIYSGPLVVLVNGQSASASELLAATLQDYNRAVIVGSPTYGKASGQSIFPVEYSNAIPDNEKGFAKLTNSRLYRVTGKSIQQQGVQPDILLPRFYEFASEKEALQPFALNHDSMEAYKYFKPMATLPLAGLQAASKERIRVNDTFKTLAMISARLEKITNIPFPSSWDETEAKIREAHVQHTHLKSAFSNTKWYTPANHASDKSLLSKHIIPIEMNSRWLEKLAKDVYIEECYHILTDLINHKKP